MPHLAFAPAIQRHVAVPERELLAGTVAQALAVAFDAQPSLRGYILDDQGALRRHVAIFVDGTAIRDRLGLSDSLLPDSRIFVVQALSGG